MNCARTLVVSLLFWLCGCAGNVVVDYAIGADVQVFDEGGRPVALAGQEVGVRPRPPNLASPFDWARYRDGSLDWTFFITSVGFGGDISNTGPEVVCLRFDQATIASSQREPAIPLKVASWYRSSPKYERIHAPPGADRHFTPPSLCLQPSENVFFSLTPELPALFPTRKMFNVSWPEGTPQLTSNGAGNWVRLALPVERGDRTVRMEIQLTAVDSKGRISHY